MGKHLFSVPYIKFALSGEIPFKIASTLDFPLVRTWWGIPD